MKSRLGARARAPAGGAMLALLLAAVALALFGPGHDKVPALIVIAVIAAIFVIGGTEGHAASPAGLRRDRSRYPEPPRPTERDSEEQEEADPSNRRGERR